MQFIVIMRGGPYPAVV